MGSLKQAKEMYHSIPVPNELEEIVSDTIRKTRGEKKFKSHWVRYTTGALTCACICGLFIFNALPALAEQLYEVPVLGTVVKVFTFWRFEETNEEYYMHVNIPKLSNTGNTELEKRVNAEITYKMNQKLQEAKVRAKEFYQAYLETGGKKEEYIPMEIFIDYTLYCSNSQTVSFSIFKGETQASFYAEYDFYNIDMQTGQELTLANLLGENYIEKANSEIKAQIEAWERENPENLYFHDELGFTSIRPDQPFYINSSGKVVIVFQKYEIAPGYMGMREFEIP